MIFIILFAFKIEEKQWLLGVVGRKICREGLIIGKLIILRLADIIIDSKIVPIHYRKKK